jgi:hypothetical protein
MSKFFEIATKNRVVEKVSQRPIRGRQGRWYYEDFYILAEDEFRARQLLENKIQNRLVIGVRREKRRGLRRQVEICEMREI